MVVPQFSGSSVSPRLRVSRQYNSCRRWIVESGTKESGPRHECRGPSLRCVEPSDQTVAVSLFAGAWTGTAVAAGTCAGAGGACVR